MLYAIICICCYKHSHAHTSLQLNFNKYHHQQTPLLNTHTYIFPVNTAVRRIACATTSFAKSNRVVKKRNETRTEILFQEFTRIVYKYIYAPCFCIYCKHDGCIPVFPALFRIPFSLSLIPLRHPNLSASHTSTCHLSHLLLYGIFLTLFEIFISSGYMWILLTHSHRMNRMLHIKFTVCFCCCFSSFVFFSFCLLVCLCVISEYDASILYVCYFKPKKIRNFGVFCEFQWLAIYFNAKTYHEFLELYIWTSFFVTKWYWIFVVCHLNLQRHQNVVSI